MQKPLPHHSDDWNGYTLDELRYYRAYTAARIEISSDRLKSRVGQVAKNGKKGFAPSGVIGKLLGAMSYVDLGLIVWKIAATSFRLFRRIKR